MAFADDLKKQLQQQAEKLLFDASKGVGADLTALGEAVSALFQNGIDNVPAEDFEAAKAKIEASLGEALDTFSAIIKAGADLKAGKLPS
jgi:hypothetical protein